MNTSNIKKYAPVARKQFRDAVIQKLTTLGIEADKKGNLQISQATDLGDSVRYGQFTLEKSLTARRERLVKQAEKQGYEVLVEHIAYTWFNRFCAIRYMELHGYLDHGFRMLSHPTLEGGYEVLDHVPEVADSLGLDKSRLVEMKLAGDRDEELYRELLLAQCHALQGAMPFLFEAVNDDIELVLPDNLTRTDSILRGLVDEKAMPKEDWDQIEVIGWLYQFYISEKKDDVIGKVVKSEDIPAATQLFTPNWIVQYLVQNSLGRQWLQSYPDSSLKDKMPYYIEPAEQTQEVQAQLAEITPSSIEPESIKVLDPACGSGHILTEAYNVLKAIYEERGYRTRDIPQLILENNIFGLDIDDRAAQLSGFAMLMLARQDDRRILARNVRLNIVSLQESKLDIAELWSKLNFHQQAQRGSMGDMFAEGTTLANTDSKEYKLLMRTLALFTNAKTLGSLIQVPQEDEVALKAFLDGLYRLAVEGDIQQKEAAVELIPYIQQAWILAQRYDAVVANPPYMGGKGMNGELKEFAKKQFSDSKSDLFAMFMQHAFSLLKENGFNAQVNMQTWMFLSGFEKLRISLIKDKNIISLAHFGSRAFETISGEIVQTCAWIMQNKKHNGFLSDFFGLLDGNSQQKKENLLRRVKKYTIDATDFFTVIPGSPVAYWISNDYYNIFKVSGKLSDKSIIRAGMATGDNDSHIRLWFEIDHKKSYFNATNRDDIWQKPLKKWVPFNKGGEQRKWYGNQDYLINYDKKSYAILKQSGNRCPSEEFYFKECITWSDVTSGDFGARYYPAGSILSSVGNSVYETNTSIWILLCNMISKVAINSMKIINPTLHANPGDVARLPYAEIDSSKAKNIALRAIGISKNDWDSFEISWGFLRNPLLSYHENNKPNSLKNSFEFYNDYSEKITDELIEIETENNTLINNAFGFENLPSKQFKEDITLNRNIHFRYPSYEHYDIKKMKYRSETLSDFISYIIGCQMGRYSLDREGLVYAHEGNKGFADLVAEGAYKTFPADEDGILPLMDTDWFDDDVTARVKEFVSTVWGEEHLQENLNFIAESLCLYAIKPKKGESSLDTIRRYLSTQFWKDHMKMYKKRPIYWLFSSGKEKAFECLVYLHRYNDATLSRMRTEYVVPLLARYQGNIDLVSDQLKSVESGAATTRLKKELDGLSKKFNELRNFDDRLRHYADMRITIDLDDGVKVNYGKFGDLLADVKAITGSTPQEA